MLEKLNLPKEYLIETNKKDRVTFRRSDQELANVTQRDVRLVVTLINYEYGRYSEAEFGKDEHEKAIEFIESEFKDMREKLEKKKLVSK